jgi:hypothetical protein
VGKEAEEEIDQHHPGGDEQGEIEPPQPHQHQQEQEPEEAIGIQPRVLLPKVFDTVCHSCPPKKINDLNKELGASRGCLPPFLWFHYTGHIWTVKARNVKIV